VPAPSTAIFSMGLIMGFDNSVAGSTAHSRTAFYFPVKFGVRFSKNARTPSS
jgi:hypothetical protein